MRARLSLLLLAVCAVAHVARAEPDESTKLRSKPREITTVGLESHAPVFVKQAKTLDPIDIARDAWKGYLTKMCEPWGMLPGGKPTYRFWFNNRVLPWAVLEHHAVDGFDNNNRNLGAHAHLREMLGAEKANDPIEAGQIGYLMSCIDPEGGLAFSPDLMPRHCALGHGELAKNVLLFYEQAREQWLKDWAKKMLDTLRRYAHVSHLEGVGPIAEFWQGGNGGQGGFNVGEPPVSEKPKDVSLEGWQSLYNGFNIFAFSKWHELTGGKEELDFAIALANRLMNSADEHGNDGSLRPDGSFGSLKGTVGSIHTHGHSHGLLGLIHLGGQLIKENRKQEGLRFLTQAQRSFDFFYDRAQNPDAGSLTGWIPEFLSICGGPTWAKHPGDCEGCTIGDVMQASCMLGAASRLDPALAGQVHYYDRAEQIFRGQLVESIFKVSPEYLAIVKKNLQKQVKTDMPDASESDRAKEVELRYRKSQANAECMEGRIVGACGFPDWINNRPWDPDPTLRRVNMMGCCADSTIRAAHGIWSETVTGDEKETRVNLAFNRKSPLVDVVSCLPHRGEINVFVKDARKVLVRIPEWAPREKTKAYVDKSSIDMQWEGSYVVFDKVERGKRLTVTYPLRIAEVKEVIRGYEFVEYTEKWRGNSIVDISPPGTMLPMFNRPELDTEQLP
jgi:hypothetical protein